MRQTKISPSRRVDSARPHDPQVAHTTRLTPCLLLALFVIESAVSGIGVVGTGLRARLARGAEKEATENALQYRCQPGEIYAYDVKVEADLGDFVEELKGTPRYTVQSVTGDEIKLRFWGSLIATRRTKPQQQGRFGQPFPRMVFPAVRPPFSQLTGVAPGGLTGESELVLNPRGEIVRMRGTSQLPYLLGNLSQLMLETFPAKRRKKWTIKTDVSITESRSRFPVPSFLPEQDQTATAATQTVTYRIVEERDGQVVLAKTLSLKTSNRIDGKPRFEIEGNGEVVFDAKRGLPSRSKFKQRITVREPNKTMQIPVTVTYRLLSEAERKEREERAKALAAEQAKPPTGAERDRTLADLKSGDQSRFFRRLIELQRKKPAQPDDEIATALAAYLTHSQSSTRFAAAKALENWATVQTVPALLKAMEDEFVFVRHSAMKALARLKARQAAEPIAKRLPESSDRFAASRALKQLGPDAEAAVQKYATHSDWQVRVEVCRILEAIGTSKSTSVLKKLQSDSNTLVRQTATKALEQITARQ